MKTERFNTVFEALYDDPAKAAEMQARAEEIIAREQASTPTIEAFRAMVRSKGFPCEGDAEHQETRRKFQNADQSNRIEGNIPDEETSGLFQVLLEERVPVHEWERLSMGFILARRKA